MGFNRIVNSSFWTDNKVDAFSPEDKYFMLYLLTNPFSSQLGIYEMNINHASFLLGYSEDTVKVLLERFENKYKIIYYSKETDEIAIKNFLRYSIIKGGPPVHYCLKKAISAVKNKELVSMVFSHIKKYTDLSITVRGVIMEYEKHPSDQDVEHPVSELSPKSQERDMPVEAAEINETASKNPYGKYQNVFLTQEEYKNLIDSYGPELALKAIDYLDIYIEENKETKPEYAKKDHYICIIRWVATVVSEQEEKKSKKESKKQKTQNRYGDFDVTASFEQALKRSYGNMDTE